jgi:predicted CXXCH cytochrome family protein
VRGRAAAAAAAALAFGAGDPAARAEGLPPPDDRCAACHLELDDAAVDVGTFYAVDVHAREGLSCADCHGGDPHTDDEDAAMSPAAGFRGAPKPADVPRFCGRCHSDPAYMRRHNPALPVDQLALYRTSGHGRANAAGNPDVATCVSCHTAHTIRPPSEPKSTVHPTQVAHTCGRCHSDSTLMAKYRLPFDVVQKWEGSVHGVPMAEGRDLSVPTCNDCHGDHGALPPEATSVAGVCGHCHAHNRELFEASAKRAIFEELGEQGCVTCHGNHAVAKPSDALVGLDQGAVCADCHGNDGSKSSAAILHMRGALDSLRTAVDASHGLLVQAEQKGMYVTDVQFRWEEARQKLFEARTMLHRFDANALESVTRDGLERADAVRADSRKALEAYAFRRRGLLVATGFITLLALALWLRIRDIEGRAPSERPSS